MEKYDAELAVIQSVKEEKKKKCNYSGLGDLRVERTITNITNTKKKTERFVLCELPLKFQVLRIVYGIRLAISVPNR